MSKLFSKREGFTLIELMIVVAIIGILAAIAIPAFINYVKRSKTSEAPANLKALFTGASSYYESERWPRGVETGADNAAQIAASTHCLTGPMPDPGYNPSDQKNIIDWSQIPQYQALNFAPTDPVYYQYLIASSTNEADGMCGSEPGSDEIYTFSAVGDLDGDGSTSLFEMAVGTNADNALVRAPGIYTQNELE